MSFNGIERIGKSFFSGILNKHLKEQEDKDVKKFSFPSYTTITGKHLARLIKQFRQDDLLFLNPHSHNRYKKIADLMVKNYEEYRLFIEGFLSKKNTTAIINNNFFSVIAHGLAAEVTYRDINKMVGDIYLKNHDTVAFFLIAKNVKDVIVAPFRTFETNYADVIPADTLSADHLGYYTMVNNYYKEIFLTYSHLPDSKIRPVKIEVDLSDASCFTKTCDAILKGLM